MNIKQIDEKIDELFLANGVIADQDISNTKREEH